MTTPAIDLTGYLTISWTEPISIIVCLLLLASLFHPDRHMPLAVAGEGLLFPSCPSIAEFHAGELRHQIEFGGPDVSEQHR